jgi:hypothetical protein
MKLAPHLEALFAATAAGARRTDSAMAGVAAALTICALCLVVLPALAAWWQGAVP